MNVVLDRKKKKVHLMNSNFTLNEAWLKQNSPKYLGLSFYFFNNRQLRNCAQKFRVGCENMLTNFQRQFCH